MIWMVIFSLFILISLGWCLRSYRRQGLLVGCLIAIIVFGGSSFLYWNLGAYEMSLSTEALNSLPASERSYVIAQAAQDEFLDRNRIADENIVNLFKMALDLDPNQITALGSLGIIAFENKDFANAELYWSHMLSQLPPDSEQAAVISTGVNKAREFLNKANKAKQGKGESEISISLKLARAIPASMENATVFVFARELTGSPRPIVARRLPVSELPTKIIMSNADAIMGGGLFKEQQVEVLARLTLGEASGTQGDWMSERSVQTLKKKNAIEFMISPPTD